MSQNSIIKKLITLRNIILDIKTCSVSLFVSLFPCIFLFLPVDRESNIFSQEDLSNFFGSAWFQVIWKRTSCARENFLILFYAKFNQQYTGPRHARLWAPSVRAKTHIFLLVAMLVWSKFRKPYLKSPLFGSSRTNVGVFTRPEQMLEVFKKATLHLAGKDLIPLLTIRPKW